MKLIAFPAYSVRLGDSRVPLRLAFALVAATLAAGCANLQAVNSTADQLVSTASFWNSVAEEFSASCARRNQVSEVPSNCIEEKKTTAGLEDADKMLAAYFTAIEQASTSSRFSVRSGISELSSSLQSIPGINSTQAKAVSGLASFLANAATSTLEQRTIKVLIAKGAPKAEAVIDVMNDFVVPGLKKVYGREQSQIRATFQSYIQQSGSAVDLRKVDCMTGPTARHFQTGIEFLLAQEYCSRVRELAAKTAALTGYQASLKTAKAALENLQSGKDNLGNEDLARQLISQASTLKNDIAKVNKAF